MRRTLQYCLMVVMLLGLGNRAWSKAAVGTQVAAWNVMESRVWDDLDHGEQQAAAWLKLNAAGLQAENSAA